MRAGELPFSVADGGGRRAGQRLCSFSVPHLHEAVNEREPRSDLPGVPGLIRESAESIVRGLRPATAKIS